MGGGRKGGWGRLGRMGEDRKDGGGKGDEGR